MQRWHTREQATAELQKTGSDEAGASAICDNALAMYPRSVRTSTHLITGYKAGTVMGAYYPGHPGIPCDLFAISPW